MNFDMCTSYRYAAVGRGGDVRIFLCLSLVICNLALSAPNSEADSIVHVRPAVSLSLRGGCVPESSAVRALRSDRRTPELMSDDAAWRKLNENASHRKRYQLSEGSAKADACNDANVEGLGWSPLMLAAARGRAAECRRLVQEGASVNSMGCHNATALHCAAQRLDPTTVLKPRRIAFGWVKAQKEWLLSVPHVKTFCEVLSLTLSSEQGKGCYLPAAH